MTREKRGNKRTQKLTRKSRKHLRATTFFTKNEFKAKRKGGPGTRNETREHWIKIKAKKCK